jgi:peptide/nickel transport system permease protein
VAQQITTERQAAPGEGDQGGAPETHEVVGRSPWQIFWSRFKSDRVAIAGLVFIGVLVLLAVFAPWIAQHLVHHGSNELFVFSMLDQYSLPKGPNAQFWFGANGAGQDLFVRVLYGARTSLIVAVLATGLELVVGVVLGVMAGFYRGKADTVISRVMDIVLSLPVLLLALGLVSACGISDNGCLGGLIKPGLLLVSYVIGLFSWPYIARIVRGQVLSLREREFIEAARAMGSSNVRIMFREVLPNLVAPLIVYTTLVIPTNILFEASLSYLGIGVPATTPSWGREISDASQIFDAAWWTMFFPGMFLLLTTLAFNLVGDGLRDAFDPRAAAISYRRSRKRTERRTRSHAGADVADGAIQTPATP